MKRLMIAAMVVIATSVVVLTAEPEPVKDNLTLTIAVPLSVNKTTFTFIVRNNADRDAKVYPPFTDSTVLVVIHPDGKSKEYRVWKSGINAKSIATGEELMWDIDLAKWLKFEKSGRYAVHFTVNGIESAPLVIVRD